VMWALGAYFLGAVVMTAALTRHNFGTKGLVSLYVPFLTWVGLAGVLGLLFWSVFICLSLHGLTPQPLAILPLCIVGSGIWASMIVALLMPGYSVLLAAYLRFAVACEGTRAGRVGWAAKAAGLALPAGTLMFLGFGWPLPGEPFDARGAAGPGALAWASTLGALLMSRQMIPALRYGNLVHPKGTGCLTTG
jgi:hypothetical protein